RAWRRDRGQWLGKGAAQAVNAASTTRSNREAGDGRTSGSCGRGERPTTCARAPQGGGHRTGPAKVPRNLGGDPSLPGRQEDDGPPAAERQSPHVQGPPVHLHGNTLHRYQRGGHDEVSLQGGSDQNSQGARSYPRQLRRSATGRPETRQGDLRLRRGAV